MAEFKDVWMKRLEDVQRLSELEMILAELTESMKSPKSIDYSKEMCAGSGPPKDRMLATIWKKDDLIEAINERRSKIKIDGIWMEDIINSRIKSPTVRTVARLHYVDMMPVDSIELRSGYARTSVYRSKKIASKILGVGDQ